MIRIAPMSAIAFIDHRRSGAPPVPVDANLLQAPASAIVPSCGQGHPLALVAVELAVARRGCAAGASGLEAVECEGGLRGGGHRGGAFVESVFQSGRAAVGHLARVAARWDCRPALVLVRLACVGGRRRRTRCDDRESEASDRCICQYPGSFLGIVGQDPSDSKFNRLHVDTFRFFFEVCSIDSSKLLGNSPECRTSTGIFLKSADSSVTNRRAVVHASSGHLLLEQAWMLRECYEGSHSMI